MLHAALVAVISGLTILGFAGILILTAHLTRPR